MVLVASAKALEKKEGRRVVLRRERSKNKDICLPEAKTTLFWIIFKKWKEKNTRFKTVRT